MVSSWMKLLVFAFLVLLPVNAAAQSPAPQASTSSQQLMKAEELEALLAPVALYPDTLLSLVLMASTYPVEVVQADRWASQNSNLKDEQLKAAVEKQPWDESVKSLVATPSVLTMMSTKLEWTQKVGDAVLAQQADVMDAIQRLRARAQENNQLKSNEQQTLTVSPAPEGTVPAGGSPAGTGSGGTATGAQAQVISIAPTDPNNIYVPYYDPAVAYGAWPYPDYPAYDYYPAGYYPGTGILATGLAFGAAYAVGRWAWRGNNWGGGVNWGNRNIIANRPTNINNVGNNWQHRPEHRQGQRYNNPNVAQKFGGNRAAGGAGQKMDFRGKSGQQVLNPKGGKQPKAGTTGQKAGAGQQAKAGQQGKGQKAAQQGKGQKAAQQGKGQKAAQQGKGQQAKAGQKAKGGQQASKKSK